MAVHLRDSADAEIERVRREQLAARVKAEVENACLRGELVAMRNVLTEMRLFATVLPERAGAFDWKGIVEDIDQVLASDAGAPETTVLAAAEKRYDDCKWKGTSSCRADDFADEYSCEWSLSCMGVEAMRKGRYEGDV